MKRNLIAAAAVLFGLFLISSTAQAQGTTADDINMLRELERAKNLQERRLTRNDLNSTPGTSGAWWTNSTIIAGLGLSEDQKAKIARAFDNHSRNIVNNSALLEKEEAQLARLLEADSVDHGAVLNQTNRVIQSRAEVERETAVMTLEMREQLTRPQWLKLKEIQAQSNSGLYVIRQPTPVPATAPALPGQRRP